MRRSITGGLIVCLGLVAAVTLRAHHSAVLFDLSKTITLSGTMTMLDWRNPHIAVFVDVRTDAGTVEPWEFETGAPSWFKNRNMSRTDFEKSIGHPVTVEAVRAKDGSRYGYLYKIAFAGGVSVELR